MQPVQMRQPKSHVYVDGKRVYPIYENVRYGKDGTLILHQTDADIDGYDMYLIKFEDFTLNVQTDHNSRVELNTEKYLEGLSESEPGEQEAFVNIENSTSTNDTFIGICLLDNSFTVECVIDRSNVTCKPGCGVFNMLENVVLRHSYLTDSKVSKGACVEDSTVVDSKIVTTTATPRLEGAVVRDSEINSENVLDIYGTRIESSTIIAQSFLRTERLRISGVVIYSDSFNPESKLQLFTIPLPAITLHVYATRGQGLALCDDAYQHYVLVEDPNFIKELRDILVAARQVNYEDAVRYVLASIHSRINLINMLEPSGEKFSAPEYVKEE